MALPGSCLSNYNWTIGSLSPLHWTLNGYVWMLMDTKSSTSTSPHHSNCKHLTYQCFLTPIFTLVISIGLEYINNSADRDSLVTLANSNNLALLYNPKSSASFHSSCWNTGTNPDLAFCSIDPESCLLHRRVLEKSQHQPLLTIPLRLTFPVSGRPVKRWNFCKANQSLYIFLTNKLTRSLPSPDLPDMNQVYQDFCTAISFAAKNPSHSVFVKLYTVLRHQVCIAKPKTFCNPWIMTILVELQQLYLPCLTRTAEIVGQRQFRTLTFRMLAERHRALFTTSLEGQSTPPSLSHSS